MRILIRTSKWAIWARRFGSLALPLAVVPVILHRERLITSSDFHIVEGFAMAVALLALVLALGAFVRLWITGDQGWGKAATGLFFSLVGLLPFAIVIAFALDNPPVGDVTTDFERPPGLTAATERTGWSAAERAALEAAFPNARSRFYPIEAPQIYAIAAQLAEQEGWELRAGREPQSAGAEGQLNAIATTLLGWRDEVAIRVAGTPQGTVVDMRSAGLGRLHDLGDNGRRIEAWLASLDGRVTALLRTAPVAPVPADPPAPAEAG